MARLTDVREKLAEMGRASFSQLALGLGAHNESDRDEIRTLLDYWVRRGQVVPRRTVDPLAHLAGGVTESLSADDCGSGCAACGPPSAVPAGGTEPGPQRSGPARTQLRRSGRRLRASQPRPRRSISPNLRSRRGMTPEIVYEWVGE